MLLWIIGTPGRVFVALLILMVLVLVLLIVTGVLPGHSGSRRSSAGRARTRRHRTWQATQGKYALGSGGIFGVGVGGSTAKWGWLPESTSDFIFAIIGEEFGLIGTLCVTALYGGLAYAGLRVARRVLTRSAGCSPRRSRPGSSLRRR